MFEQIKDIIQKYTEKEIKPESQLFDELELTSLDVVSLVGDFEDEFDIEVPDDDIRDFSTVEDIVKYLEQHQL